VEGHQRKHRVRSAPSEVGCKLGSVSPPGAVIEALYEVPSRIGSS